MTEMGEANNNKKEWKKKYIKTGGKEPVECAGQSTTCSQNAEQAATHGMIVRNHSGAGDGGKNRREEGTFDVIARARPRPRPQNGG